MGWGIRSGLLGVGASVAFLASGAPEAAAKPIKGKLSQSGLTVIALAEDGSATTAVANPGFSLAPPAKTVTLHLRGQDGLYAGPVVVGRKGKKAIMGVEAGAKLGKVKLRDGYAKLAKRLPKAKLDMQIKALAQNKIPIGAGNFGHVASSPSGPPSDQDLDGVPGPLDVDGDGDLILDSLDVSSGAREARGSQPVEILDFFTALELPLESTVNANATSLTDQQIDAGLAGAGRLLMEILPGESAELDCGGSPNPSPPPALVGGLAYCSSGGTGQVLAPGVPPVPFPDCCDSDADGLGTLSPNPGSPPPPAVPFFGLAHGATTAQIGTGDVMIQRVVRGGAEVTFPATLEFVFATVPALVSYYDTAGTSQSISYPTAPGGPGTQGNGLPVTAGPDGDVVVTLTFWRPQRRPIPPETAAWIDVGALTYQTVVQHIGPLPGGTTLQQPCPQSALATSDPQLGPAPGAAPGFADQTTDQPASPANTLTYTVNFTDCVAALGGSWNPGEEASIHFPTTMSTFGAVAAGASQSVWFERQP